MPPLSTYQLINFSILKKTSLSFIIFIPDIHQQHRNPSLPIFAPVKKGIALILLLVFTLQTFYASGFTVWFYANRKAIANKHCINKNRPELKCDGKCFLSMKMKEAGGHQDENAPLQVKQLLEGSPYTLFNNHLSLAPPEYRINHQTVYSIRYNYLHSASLFRPPLSA